jgi:hypothetical protein
MIIGISGKAQAGKDTVCKMIIYTIWYYTFSQRLKPFGIDHYKECTAYYDTLLYNIGYQHTSFAKALKSCLSVILNKDLDKFENINFKNSRIDWLNNMTVRELLQKFGTAIRNEVCDDFWVKVCLKNCTEDCIISDVRFESEAKGIRDINGIIIRINRDGAGAGNHISETALDDYCFDYIIDNNGTEEDLLLKVKEFCKEKDLI